MRDLRRRRRSLASSSALLDPGVPMFRRLPAQQTLEDERQALVRGADRVAHSEVGSRVQEHAAEVRLQAGAPVAVAPVAAALPDGEPERAAALRRQVAVARAAVALPDGGPERVAVLRRPVAMAPVAAAQRNAVSRRKAEA
jgi:hypothetical protein